jgi:hypothetical protein
MIQATTTSQSEGFLPALPFAAASHLIWVSRDLAAVVGEPRTENRTLKLAFAKFRAEHQIIKDKLARMKKLPPRPPIKAYVMN